LPSNAKVKHRSTWSWHQVNRPWLRATSHPVKMCLNAAGVEHNLHHQSVTRSVRTISSVNASHEKKTDVWKNNVCGKSGGLFLSY